tara:strand:- start:72 stop:686 length:615 start_codon:yes stop_codon:yes gene_type:complete
MIKRKKKIIFIQAFLLITGLTIIFVTYINQQPKDKQIFLESDEQKINKKLNIAEENANTFFNIEYSGFDLSGNRFVLKSEEAVTFNEKPELVNMKKVDAMFYLNDGNNLNVKSSSGIYNTKTFDINFSGNVIAKHISHKLKADQAEYLNSKGELIISKNVEIDSPEGNLIADELLFDVENQILKIHSFNENKINANITNNEKRF